jgi:hypothetical protein
MKMCARSPLPSRSLLWYAPGAIQGPWRPRRARWPPPKSSRGRPLIHRLMATPGRPLGRPSRVAPIDGRHERHLGAAERVTRATRFTPRPSPSRSHPTSSHSAIHSAALGLKRHLRGLGPADAGRDVAMRPDVRGPRDAVLNPGHLGLGQPRSPAACSASTSPGCGYSGPSRSGRPVRPGGRDRPRLTPMAGPVRAGAPGVPDRVRGRPDQAST